MCKFWGLLSVLFITEKLNESVGRRHKFLYGIRNLIIWYSIRDITAWNVFVINLGKL